MSAGAVKAGGVFLEIGADPRKFFSALTKVNKSLGNMGRSLSSGGGRLAAAGIGMAAPIAAAVRQGAAFESTLLNIRASTGATSGEIDKIKASAMQVSQALGVGPTEAAGGMLELLKAGMSLDSVLGGAGRTAMEFAKVGEMDVAQAAVVMSDAMNVFKVSSDVAANALSSAADASSTSIAQMSEAFSMSSAVAGLAGQSIEDLSATLAILANNGVKGSDAGTSVKTMLMRLMAPADDAVGALDQLGLSVASFRGADGNMKPMVDIIGTLTQAMGGLDQTAKDDIFRRIFGADAIRAASILATSGVDGFNSMRDAMSSALPVGEKYKILMSGLAGSAGNVLAALQRMAIAVSDAVAPALASVVPFITGFIDGLTKLATDNKEAVAAFAKFAVAAIAVGSALTGLGISFQVTSFGFAGIGKAANLALMPLYATARSTLFVANSFKNCTGQLGGFAVKGVGSVLSFATQSGVALARASAGFGTLAVDAVTASTKLAASMTGTALAGVSSFARSALAMIAGYSAKSTALIAVSAANAGSMATAQVAATVSVVSATVARAAEGNMRAAAIGVQALARLGVAGTTNALIAGAQVARLTSTGSTQLLRLGVTGSTALATIGSTAISVGASTSGALIKAGTTSGGSLARLATVGTSGLMRIGSAAVVASTVTIGSLIRAAAVGVAQAGAMSLAWLGGLARMTAASAISGVAMAAAFLAPFAAIGAAVVAAGALFYAFKDQIFAALAPVGELVNQTAGYIASGFSTAVSDGVVVLGDLATTATTTFNGIYEAVAAGDLSGAMDVLWAGLHASWLRGVEALMSYVDPMTSMMQNTFTYLSATVLEIWDGMLNRMAAGWDVMESNVRKGWNFLNAAFQGADQTALNDVAIDKEMRQRELKRNKAAPMDYAGAADSVAAGREAANGQRAADRRAATVAAEGALTSLVGGKTETRAKNSQVDDLLSSIKGATSVDQLAGAGGLGDQFSTLRDLGRLTSDQEMMLSDALDKAAEGLTATATDGAKVAGDQSVTSKAEAAGTFSSVNLGGMGFGSSLAERTAKAAEDTAKGVKELVGQGGGKVAS
jgi:TP901 family phage tail tape measure protein